MSCPNRCEEGEVPHSSLEQHLSLCPLQEVECDNAGMGCEVRLAWRELRGHLEKEGQSYLMKMCAACLAVSRELSRRAGEVVELREEVRRRREEVREGLDEIERKIEEDMKRMRDKNKKSEGRMVEEMRDMEGRVKKEI